MSQCLMVEQHADAVRRYVRRRLFPSIDPVDDLVQEVLLAVWKTQAAYDGLAPLQCWVLGIARHKVDDHYRRCRKGPTSTINGYEPTIAPLIEDQLAEAQEARRITAILHQLPREYRAVLLLRYWHHRSTQDIANHLSRSEKAVERLLARARTHFRNFWEQPTHTHVAAGAEPFRKPHRSILLTT